MSSCKIMNKNGKYLDWDGTRYVCSYSSYSYFTINKSNNGDSNYYTIKRTGLSDLLNVYQGLGYNKEIREWSDLNNVNS